METMSIMSTTQINRNILSVRFTGLEKLAGLVGDIDVSDRPESPPPPLLRVWHQTWPG